MYLEARVHVHNVLRGHAAYCLDHFDQCVKAFPICSFFGFKAMVALKHMHLCCCSGLSRSLWTELSLCIYSYKVKRTSFGKGFTDSIGVILS